MVSAADPVAIAMLKGLIAGGVNVALAFQFGARAPAIGYFAEAAALGALAIGVSLVMFILALRHLGAARAGAYFSLAPFIGAVLAIALLGEPVTIRLAQSAVLMGIGLWLHLAERHDHEHRHEPIEHEHSHVHQHQHTGAGDGAAFPLASPRADAARACPLPRFAPPAHPLAWTDRSSEVSATRGRQILF